MNDVAADGVGPPTLAMETHHTRLPTRVTGNTYCTRLVAQQVWILGSQRDGVQRAGSAGLSCRRALADSR